MNSPAVSIIMNCLDGEEHLRAALESVASQTFTDWEIIFWDNGSTDGSAEIARAFGPKLRYFKAQATTPLGKARNLAIAQAKGDLIAFLDCDDLWKPEKLEKQANLFANNPRLGLACTDTAIFNGHKTLGSLFKRGKPARGMAFDQLIRSQWIAMSSAMLARKALSQLSADAAWFDESLELCEEADVFYRIAHDWELDYIDEPLTLWRVHANNATFQKFTGFAAETRHILKKHRGLFPDYDQRHPDSARLLEERANFQEAIALWARGNGRKAREILKDQRHKSRKYQLFWYASHLPGSFFKIIAHLYFALPR